MGFSTLWLLWIMLLWTFMYRNFWFVSVHVHMLIIWGGINLRVEYWVIWKLYVYLLEELQDCFPKWLHHFIFSLAIYKDSNSSTFLQTLSIVHHFEYNHPTGCKVVIPYGFDLDFPRKAKIMASSSITSWQIDVEKVETVTDIIFGGLQNHCGQWLQPWN